MHLQNTMGWLGSVKSRINCTNMRKMVGSRTDSSEESLCALLDKHFVGYNDVGSISSALNCMMLYIERKIMSNNKILHRMISYRKQEHATSNAQRFPALPFRK